MNQGSTCQVVESKCFALFGPTKIKKSEQVSKRVNEQQSNRAREQVTKSFLLFSVIKFLWKDRLRAPRGCLSGTLRNKGDQTFSLPGVKKIKQEKIKRKQHEIKIWFEQLSEEEQKLILGTTKGERARQVKIETAYNRRDFK